MPSLVSYKPKKILVRSTNWIGDAIMTLPAVRTIRENFRNASISILTHPWVADVFQANPYVDDVIFYEKKMEHQGIKGLFRLGRELRQYNFDMAILLQNAFEAAFLARLARIPVIAGYSRDVRRLLLTHPVPVTNEIKKKHQVYYYQSLLENLGLSCASSELYMKLPSDDEMWAKKLAKAHLRPAIGLNPGAAYGPAKRWPAEKYSSLAEKLQNELNAQVYVFGTKADEQAAISIKKAAGNAVDLTGKTSLAQAMAMIGECDAFVTNDSGLMHVGAAQKTPLVAIFGSTDSVATGPFSENNIVIQKDLPCVPCLKPECPSDFQCMMDISMEEVFEAVKGLIQDNFNNELAEGIEN